MVDTSIKGESIPIFSPERPKAQEFNYFKFLQKSG